MNVLVDQTRNTPLIKIQPGIIEIKGRSIPEDAFDFYEPIMDSIKKYVSSPPKHTDIIITLEYINSGSKKYLINILTFLEETVALNTEVQVKWIIDKDDDSMRELGEDLSELIELPFEFINKG